MINNRQMLEDLGIDLKRISGSGKTICPNCSHSRKNKRDLCLSVNIEDGTYKCHNCDWKGRVFERPVFEKKIYLRPVFNNKTSLSTDLVKWFSGRSIKQQTLIDFRVTEGREWMPQVFNHHFEKLKEAGNDDQSAKVEANRLARVNTVQFNYWRGDELINIKYRDGKKNFKLAKDAELIFYNINAAKDSAECIICEGEIDAMSWHQAGYKAVISVPNGASKGGKIEYLDNCHAYFENKTKIYLSTDDDTAGHALRDELARRLGYERCFTLSFDGLKDANDYLRVRGEQGLLKLLESAKEFPIAGIFSVNDLWPGVMDIYRNGLPDGDRTGDTTLDEYLRFMPGELTIVTGIPSHGKTIYLEQVSLKLCLNAGWSFGIFSPETHPKEMYILRLIKKLLGKPVSYKNISEQGMDSMRAWLTEKFHIIYPESEDFLLDTILEKAKQLVLKKGIKGLIIDPWNRIESNIPNGYSEVKYTAEQLIKIVKFNQRHGVHTFLVAHPTKMQKDVGTGNINYQVPNLYSISGSAHFFNITQNGFTVFRNDETQNTEIHIQKVKWEHLGKKGMIKYRYCDYNTRLLPLLATQSQIDAGRSNEDDICWLSGVAYSDKQADPNSNSLFGHNDKDDNNWSISTNEREPPF
ncbi:toprim domain-containing protein [Mucilaginibacter sp. NFR10]|uniref:toprim domain-containing protein n=1 Tax=Mucilaginibacter sp. NFR10 TaxID=1566292 RepID=UPI000871240C|nr:toprim domain-containing protein [Mucilaginibacter sp. NFR10]SCW88394.1 twinkle protein [Mucilaginibacter sp. NFR10]